MSAEELKYEAVLAHDRAELERMLQGSDPSEVGSALYAASRYEQDWRWVQDECLRRLTHPNLYVRWAAATCLGDLAFRRFPMERDRVIAELESATLDPTIADPTSVSLNMVREFA